MKNTLIYYKMFAIMCDNHMHGITALIYYKNLLYNIHLVKGENKLLRNNCYFKLLNMRHNNSVIKTIIL